MGKVLIVGCGGVASVAVHKCCQNSKVFDAICIASRTVSKCEALKEKLQDSYNGTITTAQVDADNTEELIALIEREKPDVVLNLALPYQDLTIMDACLATGVDYVDTANYEPEDTAKFEYKWQWAYREKFEKAGITALLGSGFDPGVTGVFSAYALKHYFDEINYIDILDCNGGDHGYPFATNFNPEINIREVSAKGSYWEDGHWVETEPMEIKREYDFPEGMIDILTLLVKSGLVPSKSEARRAVQQGGVSVNGEKVEDIKTAYAPETFDGEDFVLKRGKKNFRKIVMK